MRPTPDHVCDLSVSRRPVARLYSAAEAAEFLNCSAWWVKDQARRRRIPFSWIGGSYQFTDEHLAEIIRTFEVRPVAEPTVGGSPVQPSGALRRRAAAPVQEPGPRLMSRPPRRARTRADESAA